MTGPSAQRPVVHSPTPLIRRWTIASDLTLIEPVVETVVALCVAAGFSARHCKLNVPVAVTEAMANAMLRGNRSERTRTVQVRVELDTQSLRVDVTDEGVGFDLSTLQQSPDEADWFEREDGRGVFLMRTLMDRVESSGPDAETGHCIRLILHRT
ncbi:ATP-binding protein [Gemmatimonas sp.]|uniref:ATP-binding protein n=1 Tax=Gemmatimonas sp. TaxID=1962908 RepID=UPI00286B6E0B|nr:ATP-binding protein [Gemmatimonas sp.]